ncbi:hypothetical protein IPN35_03630 [Candidatus Peregrinibacteria bacterium]|nr:MAG: hypothetical protein IPN35_03630 [Candidatus Peregrinibacteria bacterium]
MPLTTSLLLRGRTLFLTPLISIVALLFFFLPFSSASASSCTWNGTTSTDWATSTNWTNCNSTTPQSTDDVIINGSYTNPPTLNLSGGAITINSLSLGSSASSTLTVSNGDTSTKKLIITNNATIGANGTLTHTANGTSETHKLFLDIGGDFTLNSGGTINLNSKGYASQTSSNANGYGPGKGGFLSNTGAGGGYGGNGGNSQKNASGGSTYGSATDPTAIGSSGGSGYSAASGAGGGALKLVVSGTTTLNGTITANGGTGLIYTTAYGGGGGSGGSISLTTDTLTGTGTLTANGGDGGSASYDGGGGGGGRIAVLYATRTFTGTITAIGGEGYSGQDGGAGTIYTKANSQTNGDLILDNAGRNGASTTTGTSDTFENITIQNYAKYIIANTHTITLLASSLTTTSNASLTINAGGTFTANSLTSIADFTLTNNSTLSFPAISSFGSGLTITNNGIYNHSSSTLTIPSGSTWKENGTNPQIGDTQPITDIIINGTLEFQNQNTTGSAVPFTSITINSGGNLTHQANSTSQTDGLNLDLTTFTLNSGGTINLNSKGYASQTSQSANGYGPGKGGSLSNTGAGGGYGGNGGNSQANASGGSTYGSATDPTAIGSSGGSGYSSAASGAGGGALKLVVSGTTTLNGTITANGGTGLIYTTAYGGGGGSGGSISLTTDTLTGTGTLTANGGDGGSSTYDGGGGGGGRIAVLYATRTFTGAITAIGGEGYSGQGGGAGTIYTKANSQTNGDLILDNAGRNGANTTTGTSDTFENITIQNYAKYIIANTHTITLLASSLTTTSNASLTINAGGTFIADSLTSIANFTLTNSGTFTESSLTSVTGSTIVLNTSQNLSSLTTLTGNTLTNNATLSLPVLTTFSNNTVQNNGVYNQSAFLGSTLTIPSGSTWKENGTNPQIGDTQPITDIIINGTLEFQNQNTTGSAVPFTSITINSGGNLTHQGNSTSQTDGLNLDLTTFTLNSGGTINLNSKGYASQTSSNANGYGPGKGGSLSNTGAGGGYGGNGGNSQANASGGSTYGSATDPTAIGSSGGSGYSSAASGAGGGALKLVVSGTTTLNGTITANGGTGLIYTTAYGGGGGSGGSISLTTDTLTGTGTLTANGGDGGSSTYDGGGGGGGRIAVLYATRTFTGAITAIGGNGNSGQGGGAGTIYPNITAFTTDPTSNISRNTATGNATIESIGIADSIIEHGHIWAASAPLEPIAHWKMNDNAGNTTVTDAMGNFNGTAQRNTSSLTTTGKINEALTFNGSSDYIRTPTIALNSSFTVSFWMKPTNLHNYGDPFSAGTSDKHLSFVTDADGHIYFNIGDGSNWGNPIVTGAGTLQNDQWYHVLGVYDGAKTKLYIDGVSQGVASNSAYSLNEVLNLGARTANGYYFAGQLDDIRIYDKALTDIQIAELYNSGNGTETSPVDFADLSFMRSPIAHWKMNDNAGNTTVTDAMGSFNGTAQRNTSTVTTTGKINEALTFNGSSDYVNIPDNNALDITRNITLSAWIKTTTKDNVYRRIIDKSYTVGYVLNMVGDSSGRVMTEMQHISAVGTTNVADGNWHMITSTYDGNAIRIYVDGNLQRSTAYTGSINANSYNLTIGMDNSNFPGQEKFIGSIDDVRIYDRTLSSDDIAILYNSGTGTEDSSPILSQYSTLGSTSLGSFSSNLTGLTEDVTYHTRAYITTAAGETFYGNTDVFTTTSNSPPNLPTALGSVKFVNKSLVTETQPTFTFTQSDPDVTNTLQYTIQIDDTSNFSSPIVDYTSALLAQGSASFTVGQAEGGGTYTVGAEDQTLSQGAYYWRVLSTDDFDDSSSYTVANSGEIAFIIKSPTNPFYDSPDVLTFGGLKEAVAHDIAEDASSGDFYITGYFSGTSDFDPTGGTDEQTSAGGKDVFLAKYDSDSNYLWTKVFGGTNADAANAVAVDSSGNVYVTGCFWETADFDPDIGTDEHTSAGGCDAFLTKFDSSGNHQWTKSWGGTGYDFGISVDTDTSGNIFVTGNFRETVDFDPNAGTVEKTSVGKADFFVSKFDSSGNLVWNETYGSGEHDFVSSISVTQDVNGYVYLTGGFSGTIDFDPTGGIDEKTSEGTSDIFLIKLANDGSYVWGDAMGGVGQDFGRSLSIASDGNIVLVGHFMGSADFDPTGGIDEKTSEGGKDNFTAKYAADGTLAWAKSWGGLGNDQALSVDLDDSDNAYITGNFSDLVDFDPDVGVDYQENVGYQDVFMSKMNADGSYAHASVFGGVGRDSAFSVLFQGASGTRLVGKFQEDVDFDPGNGSEVRSSVGKYNSCLVSFGVNP